jgi:hypothetical protein
VTTLESVSPARRRHLRLVNDTAPPERLAAFRILTGVFAVAYLALRSPVFLELRDRRSGLDPVGVLAGLDGPLAEPVVPIALAVALLTGVGYTAGWHFRATGVTFAIAVLVLTTYRSSWGQLLHFENLMVLHLCIVAASPAADVWSLDARRRGARRDREYAAPLRLACIVVVVSYVIAGIAKLRYGGWAWVAGDTLVNHVAYAWTRLDLLGGTPSPVAPWFVDATCLGTPAAAVALAVELAAPVALLGGWWRNVWVVSAWLMHAAILALMLIGFPYPLFLVAFAPFFPLERVADLVPGTDARGTVTP